MINQGLPDGYNFNRNIEGMNEGALKQQKQQQTLNEIYKTMPTNVVKGNPLHYGDDGLPVIENDPLAEQYDMSVENQIQMQMQAQAQAQAQAQNPNRQQQQQFNPDNFFSAPSKRGQPRPQQRPSQQVQQQQQQPIQQQPLEQTFSSVQEEQLQYHPVVKRMLNIFGIKKNARFDLEVFNERTKDKVTYTMTLISEELQSWAMLEGRTRMQLEPDVSTIYFELLFGCCSVIAIDHVPVYKAFGISVTPEEQLELDEDPLEIPIRIRKKSASILASLFWKDMIPFAEKLLEAYQEKVLGRKVQSSLDRENENKVRYVCPFDECDYYEFFLPVVDGEEKTYYCKYHGVNLVKTIDLKKEADIPLA